jgi:ribose 5-phosphate isomerase B
MAKKTEAKVMTIVAEILRQPVEELEREHHFLEDLGANSLDIISMVMRIEEVFGLGETPEHRLEQIATIGDVIALVDDLTGEGVEGSGEGRSQAAEVADLAIASDHEGTSLRVELSEWLRESGRSVEDLGPEGLQEVDFPDYARLMARAVVDGEVARGILICETGLGMSMAANKLEGVRAALATDPLLAEYARLRYDANILCLGAQFTGGAMARRCVEVFLGTEFEPTGGGRRRRHIDQLAQLERGANES